MHNRAEIYSVCSDGLHAYPIRIRARKTPLVPDLQIDGLPAAITEHASCILTTALRKLTSTDAHAKVSIDRGNAPDTPPIARNRLLAGLELPIALAVLSLHDRIDPNKLTRVLATGRIDPFRGDATLCTSIDGASLAGAVGRKMNLHVVVPSANAAAAAAECPDTRPANSLDELVIALATDAPPDLITRRRPPEPRSPGLAGMPHEVLRALEIAAAGHHHLNLIAPSSQPTGTRAARILHAILPDLTTSERRATTHIHCLIGLLPAYADRIERPPLRAPHHTASQAAILGTRDHPGEVSLAHNGLLCVDEPSELSRNTILDLAEAAKHGEIALHPGPHQHPVIRYPARFQLALATRDDDLTGRRRERISPLLDLCTMHVDIPSDSRLPDTTRTVEHMRSRVNAARGRQRRRNPNGLLNAGNHRDGLPAGIAHLARTIADLDDVDVVTTEHVDEAKQLQA